MGRYEKKNKTKRNLLVTLADKNFIQQAKQLFSSVYWNAGWCGDYMLLSHKIPENELKWFREKGIFVKKCEPLMDLLTGENNYPPVVYDKLYLFTDEFKKWNSIVFLDSDIIVKNNLEKLTKIKTFGAIVDAGNKKLKEQFFDNTIFSKDEHCKLNQISFNSGVMAINTDIITKNTLSELIGVIKNHYTEFRFADQAALNLYFYKKWRKLPSIYNVYIDKYNYNLSKHNKCVAIHFFGNVGYPPVWSEKSTYYAEWKSNLEKAEFIDLNSIIYKKDWNRLKISYYSILLKTINPYNYTRQSINKIIGNFGQWLKKKHSAIYFKLKSQIHGK